MLHACRGGRTGLVQFMRRHISDGPSSRQCLWLVRASCLQMSSAWRVEETHSEEKARLQPVRSTVGTGATGGCAQLNLVRLVTCKYICRAHNNMFPCARVHFEAADLPLDGRGPGQLLLPGHLPAHEDVPLRALPARRPAGCHDLGSCGVCRQAQGGRAELPGSEHMLNPVHA